MARERETVIFLDRNLLLLEDWMRERLITAVSAQTSRFEELSAFVRATGERRGDFTVLWFKYKPEPDVVQLVAVPGRGKTSIVQTLFRKD